MRPYRKKKELANLIRRKLGQPIVDVLIDSVQLDDAIDQACDYFGEHAGGIGNEDSIILISPERVLYDGTGRPTDPGPTKGRWRKQKQPSTIGNAILQQDGSYIIDDPSLGILVFNYDNGTGSYLTADGKYLLAEDGVYFLPTGMTPGTSGTSGTPGTTGTSGTPPCNAVTCLPFNTAHMRKEPLGSCVNPMPTHIDNQECAEEADCEGPGWCGNNLQEPHCFTETKKGDPDSVGPFWVEGDTTTKPSKQGFLFKSVYDIPSDVIAVHSHLGAGYYSTGQYESGGEALFSPLHLLMGGGGSWGMQSPTAWTDSRYGYWHGTSGGFTDIVGWEMGMQYLEMYRTLYTVKLNVQLLEQQHKIRLSPPPTSNGVIAFGCTRRVADEHLYNHIWVREYALALAMIQVGINGAKYNGITFPGGASFNADFYFSNGTSMKEKLEEQIDNGRYSTPADFFLG